MQGRRTFLRTAGLAAGVAVLEDFVPGVLSTAASGSPATQNPELSPVSFSAVSVGGELSYRAARNFDRLEEKRYQPDNVFVSDQYTEDWPGDTEGRTVLGLTLLAQATRREPRYLDQIVELFPHRMNNLGYFGKIYSDGLISEQQLSGHGWTLRGLCEYYEWRQEPRVLKLIERIIHALALATKGKHADYPIDPARREHGGSFSGTQMKQVGNWIISTDIGCDFIFLDGITHAYRLLPSEDLKSVIEEIIDLYRRIDLLTIKAQTHSSLTGIRALIRYFELTGRREYLEIANERYRLYRGQAWTENFENYNWFGRPEWTEPCAVIDSFMVAVSLWRHTGDPLYLEDAHHIYYNGIAHEQHANGGFGLNNCTGSHHPFLNVEIDEAYWCCTMRGGEGLSRAVEHSYFTHGHRIYIPFFNPSEVTIQNGGRRLALRQKTDYPYAGGVELEAKESGSDAAHEIFFFNPTWTVPGGITLNGKNIPYEKNNGFLSVRTPLKTGDILKYDFSMGVRPAKTHNPNSIAGYHRFEFGPLILGYDGKEEQEIDAQLEFTREDERNFRANGKDIVLTPIMHLLDPLVKKGDSYRRQILFKE